MSTKGFYEILIVSVIGNKETHQLLFTGIENLKPDLAHRNLRHQEFISSWAADRLPFCSLARSTAVFTQADSSPLQSFPPSFPSTSYIFPWATFGGSMDLGE